jgi:uncharacterized OB-fold protein
VKPIADGLFTDEPRLIGTRCGACGVVTFPSQSSCPRCNAEDMREELLANRGTLWTWTTQGFEPKSPPYAGPSPFEPYAVGYIELEGQCKVEARLTERDPEKLRIGMEMELVLMPYGDRTTYAFKPA